MNDPNWNQVASESPDGQHRLVLLWESEIRFGPAYYRAILDDRELSGRVFGRQCTWSHDSRFLALELWNSTQESSGPDTSLFLVRVSDQTYYDRSRIRRGFLTDVRFEGSSVLYTKDRSRTAGATEEYEIELESIEGWQPLAR